MISELKKEFTNVLAQTSPHPLGLVVTEAFGPYLFGEYGTDEEYMDFTAGIAVNALGHHDPDVIRAIRAQLEKFTHTAVYGEHVQEVQVTYARAITRSVEDLFLDSPPQVFFTNSGAEATDLALKMARKITGREMFIGIEGGFHGRTVGAMSVSWNEHYRAGMGNLLPCMWIRRNDFEHLIEWDPILDDTAAVILEIVQGEAGALPLDHDYLAQLSAKCEEHGCLLIVDEVQTGMGRTGTLWASSAITGFSPDIITVGKALGGGLPLGGVIASRVNFEKLQEPPFSHVTTFGGNPLSCAAGVATFSKVSTQEILGNVHLRNQQLLDALSEGFDVTGQGLLLGLHFTDEGATHKFVTTCHERGLIVGYKLNNPTTVRICPPLNITEEQCEFATEVMVDALK